MVTFDTARTLQVAPGPPTAGWRGGTLAPVPDPLSASDPTLAPPEGLDPELVDRLTLLARTPQLLVACDYDGTVAPLVDDPMTATPHPETVTALRALAVLPNTDVAVISGRSLRDLAALSRLPDEIHLVGSHGSEFDIGFGHSLTPEQRQLRRRIDVDVTAIANDHERITLEHKPAAVAVHYRTVPADERPAVIEAIEQGPAALDGVHLHHGDQVVELLVVDTDKGQALSALRHRLASSAVVFLGDSPTDEDAFATLHGPDLGIKVGGGESRAHLRVPSADEVATALALLCELRTDWTTGAGAVPIADHTLLSDERTAALVTPDARVTWLCAPRIDSAAVFAELVGGPTAGYFAVRPAGENGRPTQRYDGATLTCRTEWPSLVVTDYLDVSNGRSQRMAGRSDLIRVVEGTGPARVEFAPRLQFGRLATRLECRDHGVEVVGATDLIALRAPGVTWEIVDDGVHQTAVADLPMGGDPVVLELRFGTASLKADQTAEPDRRTATARHWSDWADQLDLGDVERATVERSALTLKGLCHGPTGAIVAAATTSLPETIGGIRNWDYRYCWLRDAALTAAALVRLGTPAEAMALLDWVLGIVESRDDPARLSPLYLVTGRHLPPEADLAELAGYAGSRPVRIGNAADGQVQLDVFGPIVDLVWLLGERGAPLSSSHWRLVNSMVDAVAARWHEPDHGIWEIRKPPRHHVHSKVMCWVTVDRALRVADEFVDDDHDEWVALRDRIAEDVLTNGWNEERGSFTAAYDGTDVDASTLAVGLCGLLTGDDPRFVGTVAAVERELRSGSTVYRYLEDDGLPGEEGGFHLMTSWLVDAYLLAGRRADAEALFAELVGHAGATGLLSEEVDPATGRSLGNHPQAYSHLGLINNALNLAE